MVADRMPLFKKNNKLKNNINSKTTSKDFHHYVKPNIDKKKKVRVVKKKKIGFRHKKDERFEKPPIQSKKDIKPTPIEDSKDEEEFVDVDLTETKEEKKPSKKKAIIKKDMTGKPVFLEDTGEKLGVVFKTLYDQNKVITGYKIKDHKSDSILNFSAEQFELHKEGLIFIPGWYTNALKIIEKLEFKDKISPELTALLSDDEVSNDELYDIFVKHDNEMVHFIDDAKSLRNMLTSRLRVLEKQRVSMKDQLMDLTEKRLIKDIDRRQFSEDVMEHRRKVNILDINIKKCKDLIRRLDKTSFGVLGKHNLIFHSPTKASIDKNLFDRVLNPQINRKEFDPVQMKKDDEESYKEKYFSLKAKFEQLEEEYVELKLAVDKLFNENQVKN